MNLIAFELGVFHGGRQANGPPFDVDRLQITGDAVGVIEGVQHDGRFGGEAAAYAVSDSGLLVYAPGGDVAAVAGVRAKTLVWVNQQGNEQPLLEEPRDYRNPRLSPDGERLALQLGQGHGIHQVAGTNEQGQLTLVELGDQHARVAAQ